jgi:RNA polymerase sigma factor (sigma-70 family)
MTGSGPHDALAGAFEQQRERLVAVAYRMLGSRVDAEDAVQEAWIRLARQDAAAIDNLAGWLTTVVGRVCVDVLRSRKTRAELSYDDRLPELVVTVDGGAAPEDDAVLAESVGLALLVVLDTLTPTERLAFVLHDMFAVPFAEIGEIIGRSTDATKMLASRARRKVRGTSLPEEEPRRQRAVVDAFLAAARDGDFEGRRRLPRPDRLRGDRPLRTGTLHQLTGPSPKRDTGCDPLLRVGRTRRSAVTGQGVLDELIDERSPRYGDEMGAAVRLLCRCAIRIRGYVPTRRACRRGRVDSTIARAHQHATNITRPTGGWVELPGSAQRAA